MSNTTETMKRPPIPATRISLLWCAILLVGTVLFFLLFPDTDKPLIKEAKVPFGVVLADQLEDGSHLVTTLDDTLKLIDWSEDTPAVIPVDIDQEGTINAFVSDPGRGLYALGGSTREIVIYDGRFQILRRIPVRGQITALTFSSEGQILATYGIGQFSEKYYVGSFDAEDGSMLYEAPAGFTTTSLVTSGEFVIFGTADSRVAALSEEGELLWKTTVKRAVTAMEAVPATSSVLLGDEQGGVYVIDPSGKVVWNQIISTFPVTSVAYSEQADLFLASDKNGTVTILDQSGEVIYQQQVFEAEERISRIVTTVGSDLAYLYSRKGNVVELDTRMLQNTIAAENFSRVAAYLLIFAVLGTLVVIINQFPLLRSKSLEILARIKKGRLAYLLLLPSFATLIVFSYYPISTAVYYSLTNFSLSRPLRFIGFENYVNLMSDTYFWVGMGNLLKILVTKIIKDITFPLLVAELIFWLRDSKHQYFFRTAFVIPSIVPGVVMVLLWRMIYDPSVGIINQILSQVGLGQYATAWLGNEATALWAIIFAGFPWVGVFSFLVYFGGLINISKDIYDAATIEGVGVIRRFFHIDVPMLKPQFRLILFFSYVGSIQTFADIWIYTRGGPGHATYVPGLQMFIKISEGEYGYASAIGMVLFLMAFIGTVANFRFGKKVDD